MTLLIEFIAIAAIVGILAIAMKAKGDDQTDSSSTEATPHEPA